MKQRNQRNHKKYSPVKRYIVVMELNPGESRQLGKEQGGLLN